MENKFRILFVGRSIFHFSYYESLIKALCERGHIVEALFDEQWSKSQPHESLQSFERLGYKCFTRDWSKRRTGLTRSLLLGIRELRSYASYLQRPEQSDFYLNRWASYLPSNIRSFVAKPWAKSILASRVMGKLFPLFESMFPVETEVVKDIRTRNPDLIIVSPGNMRFDDEIEYLKAARAMGIPSAILVLSWDNLTTKGLFHVQPNLLLCWNQAHAVEAAEIHKMPADRVVQIGSTFFDKWFQGDQLKLERASFCMRVGIDSTRPFVLYLGSSSNIAVDESWLVEDVWRALRGHPDPKVSSAQLLVRPHPANAKNYLRLDGLEGLAVWPKTGTLPESDEAQLDFVNSALHAVASMGINTSGMIDTIILGRPCIALVVDQYAKTQNEAVHFGHLYRSGAMDIAKGSAACVHAMASLLSGIDTKSAERAAFVKAFVRPWGLQHAAGDLGAMALERLGEHKKWDLSTNSEFELSIRKLS